MEGVLTLSPRATRYALIATVLGSSIAFIDSTVINVALPAIQRDLGGGLAAPQWIVDAYLVTLGSLILVGGSLGDIFGEVRMFTLGVALFGVASLLCARLPVDLNYWADLFPSLVGFAVALALTVAPLTTTVLSDAGPGDAGIASGIRTSGRNRVLTHRGALVIADETRRRLRPGG